VAAMASGIPASQDHAGLFLGFFFRLRRAGLPVSPTEWLALAEGLARGLHGSSLIGFYSLARCLLVKDESRLDTFDQVFAEHFRGVEAMRALEKDIWDWLENPIPPFPIDPEMRSVLDRVDVERLRQLFEERLRQQDGRHDGGDRWIGTGGTSPFGHSGLHPGGIRLGGEGRLGSAVQVAGARRYREHRHDLALDVRQFSVALRKLRRLQRLGAASELDLPGTIDRSAREAGDLALVFQPPRRNNLSLLLLLDVGGSMDPYRRLVSLLFSAAHASRHFRRLESYYFHNCVYDHVYRDVAFEDRVPTAELLRRWDRDARLVLVGDAYMYPGELTDRHGAIQWEDRNETPGLIWLRRLRQHFRRAAWVNPMSRRMWEAPSVVMIGNVFDMWPLTVEGVERLAAGLAKHGGG